MANYNADLATNLAAVPPVRTKANRVHGRIRIFRATYTVPASPAFVIGDTITWGSLPIGARTLGYLGQLNCSVGTAATTLNIGDAASAARHLAATSVAVAALAVPNAANANGVDFETTDGSTAATNNCILISTLAGGVLLVGQVINLTMPYVCD